MVERFDLSELRDSVDQHGCVVRVVISEFKGSAPRETGASMLVWAEGQSGTIGGGALEWQAAKLARDVLMMQGDWRRQVKSFPLGPELNQCCGGHVELLLERFTLHELNEIDKTATGFTRPKQDGISPLPAPFQASIQRRLDRSGAGGNGEISGWLREDFVTSKTPLWLYGAGHVGREIVRVLDGLPFDVTWVDTARNRFPEEIDVEWRANVNPAALVKDAPANALHFVLTYSHAHDFEICHQVLSRPFGHLGLIGSKSKKARFLKRLRELGHSNTTLNRMECPIGDRSLGKTPQAIAIGLAYSLLQFNIQEKSASGRASA